jgi:hypothetical protein
MDKLNRYTIQCLKDSLIYNLKINENLLYLSEAKGSYFYVNLINNEYHTIKYENSYLSYKNELCLDPEEYKWYLSYIDKYRTNSYDFIVYLNDNKSILQNNLKYSNNQFCFRFTGYNPINYIKKQLIINEASNQLLLIHNDIQLHDTPPFTTNIEPTEVIEHNEVIEQNKVITPIEQQEVLISIEPPKVIEHNEVITNEHNDGITHDEQPEVIKPKQTRGRKPKTTDEELKIKKKYKLTVK